MYHLKSIALKYWKLIAICFVLGVFQAFLQSFSAHYLKRIIDSFTGHSLTVETIVVYGSAIVMLHITNYVYEYPGQRLEHGIGLSLKTEALRKISVIAYLSYVRIGTGTLIQRIENGAAAGRNILFGFYLNLISRLIPEIVMSIAFIYMINRTVTVVILVGYVAIFIITNLLLKLLYRVKASILINEEKFNHFLVRGFMEMVVFRVNRRYKQEIRKAETAAEEIVSSKVRMKLIHEAFFVIFAVLVDLVEIGIIVFGWTSQSLTIGEIVALIALIDKAYAPIAIFNVLYVQFKLDKVAYARYAEFLDAKEDEHLTIGIPAAHVAGDISFENISFQYGNRTLFSGLSLHVRQGTSTAFVGESGSGKSTAAKLIAGLLHPERGRILIGDTDLNQINLNGYYGHIAYLPQEPPVFDGTLRENLVFDEEAADEHLLDAIGKAGLQNLYSKMEKGLDTPLGERGISLSGGERQQIALARLWFSTAGIVILDEATSAMDNMTEELVMKNVLSLLAGKTVVAIAHRLDSIRSFDSILVFRNGDVVEQGTFTELMDRQQYFNELYTRPMV